MVVFCFFVAFILRKKLFLSIFSLILRRVSDTCLKSDGYEYGYDFSPVSTCMDIKFYLQTFYRWIGNYSTQVKLNPLSSYQPTGLALGCLARLLGGVGLGQVRPSLLGGVDVTAAGLGNSPHGRAPLACVPGAHQTIPLPRAQRGGLVLSSFRQVQILLRFPETGTGRMA
jgi:hypothetical protein